MGCGIRPVLSLTDAPPRSTDGGGWIPVAYPHFRRFLGPRPGGARACTLRNAPGWRGADRCSDREAGDAAQAADAPPLTPFCDAKREECDADPAIGMDPAASGGSNRAAVPGRLSPSIAAARALQAAGRESPRSHPGVHTLPLLFARGRAAGGGNRRLSG